MIERLYTLLLAAWPKSVRDRLGGDMRATFRARLSARRASGRAMLPLAVRELAGVVLSGLTMRLTLMRGRRSARKAGGIPMERWAQDIRIALRGIVRNPVFSVVVVLVLALGIGANTAIFSVLNATLLRQVPVHTPDRLVTIRESNPEKGWDAESAAPANMLDWAEGVAAFEGVAAHTTSGGIPFTGDGDPEVVLSVSVTGNWFDVLGATAALGRTFRDEETWQPGDRTVVLSDGFWARRFGRDPAVLGRRLTLNGVDREVIGIMPAGFTFPEQSVDVWTPSEWNPEWRTMVFFRRAHWLEAIARVRPGVPLDQANAELQVVVARLQNDYPETNRVMGAVMFPLQDYLTAEMRPPLLLLQGAVLLLLLVACANVGNLLLVRSAGRRRELAVRAALGAGRGRVVSLVLSESLILATIGGAAGLVLGAIAIRTLGGLLPTWVPADVLSMDMRVLFFALAITLVAGVAFGLAPALRRTEIEAVLRDGGRSGSASRHTLRAANLLVVTEVALALVLVLGAGLMLRSFGALREIDPGFQYADRVTATINVPTLAGTEVSATTAFFDRVQEGIGAIPGVREVALSSALPLVDRGYTTDFRVRDWDATQFGVEVAHQSVSPNYFRTLGIPLVSGRYLEPTDRRDAENVVVINEAMARRHFAGEDPVDRRIAFARTANDETTWHRIVGVVGDTRQSGLRNEPIIQVYQTYWQDATGSLKAIVHTTLPPGEAIPRIRTAVLDVNANVPIAATRTMDDVYAASLRGDRFVLVLIAGFAGLSLLLASLGVYGVVSQTAKRRTQEIGIRVALGARRSDVLRLMFTQAIGIVGAGVVLGVLGGLALTRFMGSLLYGVTPNDPATFVLVPIVLAAVALVATWLPARGATRVNPLIALRE